MLDATCLKIKGFEGFLFFLFLKINREHIDRFVNVDSVLNIFVYNFGSVFDESSILEIYFNKTILGIIFLFLLVPLFAES